MRRRSSKNEDEIQAARRVADIATGERPKVDPKVSKAAAALGRLGGLKGGDARAAALAPERRVEIARQAAAARWKTKPEKV
jgi:hypothetical protein